MNTRIYPATLEELQQEVSETQSALGTLSPGGYDAQQVIEGLRQLRQEIHEAAQPIYSLPSNYSAS
jgi:hypothetical protein